MDKLVENLLGFLETRIALFKIEAKEELVKGTSRFLLFTFFLFFFSLTVIFASITLSLYLNEVFSSSFLGFGVVTIIYLLIFIILIMTRNAPFWQRLIHKLINYSEESTKKENGRPREEKGDPKSEE
ncbi:phage holin family protein [Cytophagales bacterium EPR-FJ-38]